MSYARSFARVRARLDAQEEAATVGWRLTRDGQPFGETFRTAGLANLALSSLLDDYFRKNPDAESHPFNYARVMKQTGAQS